MKKLNPILFVALLLGVWACSTTDEKAVDNTV